MQITMSYTTMVFHLSLSGTYLSQGNMRLCEKSPFFA
jgi:hypothetical protein